MKRSLSTLVQEVAVARSEFIKACSGLTATQASYKPSPDSWCVIENAEHLVWAEQGGINGMWKALIAFRNGNPVYNGELTHHGRSIEEVVDLTWKPKEIVPEVAKPRLGGPLEFWTLSLANLQVLLEAFAKDVREGELEQVIHPHPISGPLNFRQRFEFLRFHLNRHQKQVENIIAGFQK
jgi:hypothetical protein